MNTREYHITFCSTCTNRQFNPKKGLECKLTDTIADFEVNCKNYNLDKIELEKIKKSLKNKTEKTYNNSSEFNFNLGSDKDTYESIIPTKGVYFKNKEATQDLIKGREKGIYYILLFIGFFSLILNYIWLEANNFVVNVPIIILSVIQLSFYIFMIRMLKDEKTYFRTTKFYFEINQQRFYFNDIISLGKATGNEKIPRVDLVIGTKSKGLIQLNMDNVAIAMEDIAEIVKYNEA